MNKPVRSKRKVFVLPRAAKLLNHKEKQRGCPLLDANKRKVGFTHSRSRLVSPRHSWALASRCKQFRPHDN